MFRRFTCSIALLFLAGAANATTYYYGQLMTPLGSGSATLTTDFDVLNVSLSGSGIPGGGLVAPSLSYTHIFAPSVPVGQILSAALSVALFDDANPFSDFVNPNEWASISLDGLAWQNGQAVLNVLSGAVTVTTFSTDGQLGVTVTSNATDFVVASSLFKVRFNDTAASTAPVVPEPAALFVFGAGALIVAGVLRRRAAA